MHRQDEKDADDTRQQQLAAANHHQQHHVASHSDRCLPVPQRVLRAGCAPLKRLKRDAMRARADTVVQCGGSNAPCRGAATRCAFGTRPRSNVPHGGNRTISVSPQPELELSATPSALTLSSQPQPSALSSQPQPSDSASDLSLSPQPQPRLSISSQPWLSLGSACVQACPLAWRAGADKH
eukprot:gene12640-biopygen8167